MATEAEPLKIAYKGFDKDLRCRGFQFEEGKTYHHNGAVKACVSGFHVCTNPLDVLRYYRPTNGSRYHEVAYGGAVDAHNQDSKLAVETLEVRASIGLAGIISLGVKAVIARAKDKTKPASGYSSTGAASGEYSTGAASGRSSTGAASGYYSTGAASGDYSTGAASGDYSTGAASGYSSTGAASGRSSTGAASGYYSTGAASGDYSTGAASGDCSTGAASGDCSTGAASGDYSTAKVFGRGSIAVATGRCAKASAAQGSAFVLPVYNDTGDVSELLVGIPGSDGIEPDTLYTVRDGKLVEAE